MTKYKLLPEELHLLTDAGHYRIRVGLANKVMSMLGICAEAGRDFYARHAGILPAEVSASAPKISRGENYQGFPWMVLDYPRYFSNKDIFVIRSLCWWGNSFSIALLLSGVYARTYNQIVTERLRTLPNSEELFVCCYKDPWQHHFGTENYIQPKNLDELCRLTDQTYRSYDFIKLCRRFPLEQWNHFPSAFEETHELYLKLLQ